MELNSLCLAQIYLTVFPSYIFHDYLDKWQTFELTETKQNKKWQGDWQM